MHIFHLERDPYTKKVIYVGMPSAKSPYVVHVVNIHNDRVAMLQGVEIRIIDAYNDGVRCRHHLGLNWMETAAHVIVVEEKEVYHGDDGQV